MIRPMIYVLEKDIVTIARQLERPVVANNCPADGTTKRADMKSLLEQMEKDNPFLIERMQSAITNGIWQQYLIEPGRLLYPLLKRMTAARNKEELLCLPKSKAAP